MPFQTRWFLSSFTHQIDMLDGTRVSGQYHISINIIFLLAYRHIPCILIKSHSPTIFAHPNHPNITGDIFPSRTSLTGHQSGPIISLQGRWLRRDRQRPGLEKNTMRWVLNPEQLRIFFWENMENMRCLHMFTVNFQLLGLKKGIEHNLHLRMIAVHHCKTWVTWGFPRNLNIKTLFKPPTNVFNAWRLCEIDMVETVSPHTDWISLTWLPYQMGDMN